MAATEQTTKPGNLANVASRIKTLRAVHQVRGSYEILKNPGPPPYRAVMARPVWGFDRVSDTALAITGVFAFKGDKGKDDETPNDADAVVRVDATFFILYDLEPGEPFSDEDIKAFANLNTHLNVYPFWREYVHDALSRSGMAPMLIPPFYPFKNAAQPRPPVPPTQAPKPE